MALISPMLRRATAFLLCALTAVPPQTAFAATAVFRSPTAAAQSTTPMIMSSNVPQGRIDDPYLAQFRATGGVPPYGYELIGGTVPTGTAFNSSTGDISGTPPVPGTYTGIKVRATDQNGATATSQAYTVTISGRALSTTTNIPLTAILGQPYYGSVGAKGGTKPLVFTIYSGSLPEGLSINTATGEITGVPTSRGTRTFSIRTVDSTKPSSYASTTALQSISVDYAPLAVSCPPCAGVQTAVGNPYDATFVATGGQGPYTYFVQAGALPPGISLDRTTGRLSGTPTKAGTFAGIVVQASDVDSRYVLTPAFQFAVQATVAVAGTPAPYATVGESYAAAFQAIGGRDPYGWNLIGTLPPGLAFDAGSGAIAGAPPQVGAYGGLQARAVDADGRAAVSNPFAISVAQPVAVAGSTVDATMGQPYRVDFSASGGRGPYVFSVASGTLPPGLTLGQSGALSGTPSTLGSYQDIAVRATDVDGRSAVRGPLSIAVLGPMSVAGAMPGSATLGESYVASFSATGGRGPYAWSIGGTLPPGLSISPTSGVVSGRPTATGSYGGITVAARDADGRTASAGPFSIGISDPLRLSVDRAPDRYSTVGEPIAISTFKGAGGTVPYAFSLQGELPSGLVYDAARHAISGTPTAPGSWSGISVALRDGEGRSTSIGPYAIDVANPVLISARPADVAVGDVVDYAATVTGGVGPYTCSLFAGSWPPGLRFESAGSCRIVGTATASGSFSLALAAADTQGRIGVTQPFDWHILDPLTVRGTPPSVATVGTAYAAQFDVVGGAGPYAWSLAAGTLPAGILLDTASGSISGSPTAAGLASGLQVKATDAAGRTALSTAFALDVRDRLSVAGSPSANATVGQAYSATFAAVGGRGPYAYALVGGPLPAGLSLSSSGILSGTPTSVASATGLRVRATDADGRTASTDAFAITVSDGLLVSGSPAAQGTLGTAYAAAFTATGGSPAYVWSLAAGTLPAGLVLDPAAGTITGSPTLAGLASGLLIKATDAAGRTASSAIFAIDVRDVLTISGSPSPNATFGKAYAASFTAAGGRAAYTFKVVAGVLPGGLSLSSSGAISGSPTVIGTATGIQVGATDADGRTAASQPFSIVVATDVAVSGNPPTISTVGQSYAAAFAATGGTTPYVWNLSSGTLPAGLTLDVASGTITGSPQFAGVAAGVKVAATDAVGRTAASASFAIDVRDPLTISGTPSPVATIGAAYSAGFVAAGGRPGYVYRLAAGTLPTGLTLTSAGRIVGSPTASGVASDLRIGVVDADGRTALSPVFSIAVSADLVASGNPPAFATVGQPYSATFTAAGGTGPYAWTLAAGILPTGLTFDPATGAIGGSPVATGTATEIRLRVTDVDGRTADTPSFSIDVRSVLGIEGAPPAIGTVGKTYSASFSATGGRGGYSFGLAAGALPSGLVLSSAGVLSGSPTTASSTTGLQVRATDADGRTALSQIFSIKISADLVVSGSPTATGTVGQAYAAAFSAAGGATPYVWSVAAGTLPAGLTLDSAAGTIAGSPTEAGFASGITIRVADAEGRTANTAAFSIDVRDVLSISGSPSPDATLGQAYSASYVALGGRSGYRFSLVAGALPAGISLSSAGVLSGEPTAAGSFAGLQVKVTDADGRTALSSPFSITVTANVTVAGTPAAYGTIGQTYSAPFVATGGTGPYAWNLDAGTLPAGLALSASGAVSGTPTASGDAAGLRVRATDAAGRTGMSRTFSIAVAQPLSVAGAPSDRATIGTAYSATFSASGGRAPYVFDAGLGTLPAGLAINAAGVLAGVPTTVETRTDLQVRAVDADGRVAYSAPFRVAVSDPLTISGIPPASVTAGETYAFTFQASGGAKPYAFSVAAGTLPPGLTLSAAGTISGTAATAGSFPGIQVAVADRDGRAASGGAFSIAVYAPLTISGTAPETAVVGRAYGAQFAGAGGHAPYLFAISGALPDGLTFDPAAGKLSGMPSVAGTFSGLTVSIRDADGRTASLPPFGISVTGGLTVAGTPPTMVVQGEYYQGSLSAVGGTAPYTFVLATGDLPDGVSLGSDGSIGGWTSRVATHAFRVQATDASGTKALSRQFDVQVLAPVRLVGNLPQNWDLGVYGEYRFQATGGRGPYTFSIDPAKPLPAGLTIEPDTGRIFGTPTQKGEYYWRSIVVADADGRTAGGQWTMSVWDPMKAWIEAIPSATQGEPFTVAIRCSGPQYGCGFTSRYVPSRLPPGLSVVNDPNDDFVGHISGTPTAAGQFTGAGIWVHDSHDRNFYLSDIDILVIAPVAVTGNWTSYGVVGQPYASTFGGSGGRSPLTFSLGAGTLPAGLSIDPNSGRISGTPTRAETQAGIRVRATDPDGRTGLSASYTLTISLPLTIAGDPPATGVVGTPYSVQFAAAGGRQPYAYALLGSLPDGLKLAPSTGLISGTPTTAVTATNISVVASDSDGRKASTQPFSIAIAGPLAIAGTPSPAARVGTAYTATFAASGGTGSYAISLASGSLPAGLTLSSSGRITGAPTQAGTFSYAVAAADAAGATATTPTFQLQVNSAVAPLAIGAVPNRIGTVGSSYEARYYGIEGTAPYAYALSSGSLPDGVILTDTGRVLGVPTAKGVSRFTVTVTDASGQTARTDEQTIDVGDPLVMQEQYRDVRAIVGDSGDMDLGVTGGTGPYTVHLVDGSDALPAGITLDADHLRLYGTYTFANPTYASITFQYTVVDAVGRTTTVGTIWFNIGSAMIVDPPLYAIYVKGAEIIQWWYNYKPSSRAAGGRGPWSVEYSAVGADAKLPPGLVEALGPGGECSWFCGIPEGESYFGWPDHPPMPVDSPYGSFYWTPTESGTFGPVRITLRDSEGREAVAETPVVTVADPFAYVAALPDAVVGKPYAVDLREVGGLAPFAYRKMAGILPDGLVLDPATGRISGVPTGAAGVYEPLQFTVDWANGWFRDVQSPVYRLVVTDPDNRPASPLTVAVVGSNPPARVIKGKEDGESNDTIETVNRTFKAAGGTPPYTFSLSPGIVGLPNICRPDAWWCSERDAGLDYKVPALAIDQNGVFSRVRIGYDPWYGTVYKPVPAGPIGNIRIRVTDSTGATADSAPFAMDFQKPVGLGGAFPANLVVGDAVNVVATAADGWEPIVMTGAVLPPGLSASISGRAVTITGTVTTPGTYAGSVAVHDDFPSTATWSFPATVRQRVANLALQGPGNTTVTSGDYYAITWTPTGGVQPYWVKILSGTLPPGATLDYRGILEGTTNSVGTWSDIVLQVVDADGKTAVADPVTITVQSKSTQPEEPQGGDCQDGGYCLIRFTAGIPPFDGPIAPNVPMGAIVEAHSPYYRAPGVIGWPGNVYDQNGNPIDASPGNRWGPNVGDASILRFEFVNAPSWLTWAGSATTTGIDDETSPWWGYYVYGYFNQIGLRAVPPAIGAPNDQTGYVPGPYENGYDPPGGGGSPEGPPPGGFPGLPPILGIQ